MRIIRIVLFSLFCWGVVASVEAQELSITALSSGSTNLEQPDLEQSDLEQSDLQQSNVRQPEPDIGTLQLSYMAVEAAVDFPLRRRWNISSSLGWDQWNLMTSDSNTTGDIPLPDSLQTVFLESTQQIRLSYHWALELGIGLEFLGDETLSAEGYAPEGTVVLFYKINPQWLIGVALNYDPLLGEWNGGIGFEWQITRQWHLSVVGEVNLSYTFSEAWSATVFANSLGAVYPVSVPVRESSRTSASDTTDLEFDTNRAGLQVDYSTEAWAGTLTVGSLLNPTWEYPDEDIPTLEAENTLFVEGALTLSW